MAAAKKPAKQPRWKLEQASQPKPLEPAQTFRSRGWVATVDYYHQQHDEKLTGGCWMAAAGESAEEAKVNAIARHKRILGAPPPKGSRVSLWLDDKLQREEKL